MRLVVASTEELVCWWLLLEEKVEMVGVVEDGGYHNSVKGGAIGHSGDGEGAGLLVAGFGNV
jgi:hypothetical protein